MFLFSLIRLCMCVRQILLCHKHVSSSFVRKQCMIFDAWCRSSIYCLLFFPTNTILTNVSNIRQWLYSKTTLYPSSHNWLILIRLCFKPSTRRTSLILNEDLLLMVPTPRIFPLLLSPQFMNPSFLKLNFAN